MTDLGFPPLQQRLQLDVSPHGPTLGTWGPAEWQLGALLCPLLVPPAPGVQSCETPCAQAGSIPHRGSGSLGLVMGTSPCSRVGMG